MRAAVPILTALALCACRSDPPALVTVNDARVIALPTSAGAYFTLANSGGGDRLLSVEAPGVGQASLHETSMAGGIMRMRPIDAGIAVPANGRVTLGPGGQHVMIERLARPLTDGSTVKLNLRFQRQGVVTISAPVSGPR